MEKYMILLLSLPFVSVVIVTILNLINNPVGTIQGMSTFIQRLTNKEVEK